MTTKVLIYSVVERLNSIPVMDVMNGVEVHSMINPVTGSPVTLVPPLRISNSSRFEDFRNAFEQWCIASWQLGRLDPESFECTQWVHADAEGAAEEEAAATYRDLMVALAVQNYPELFEPGSGRYWTSIKEAIHSVRAEKASESSGCERFNGANSCTCAQ